MVRSWPLTGRDEELRFVEAQLRPAEQPRGVVLAGMAGVGKTRLALEALAAAEERGLETRWVSATVSARRVPLGAFAEVVGPIDGDPLRVLHRATEALLADRGGTGILVGVDDAHLLDDLSALLIHQLVLGRSATVVVTVRTGEPCPDAVRALWKDRHLERLEIQPLSEPENRSLLAAVMGGPVDGAAAARMWRLTAGNTLYLRQLVDGERESGRLVESDGVWRWSGKPVISSGLTDLVSARMGALTEEVREVVDVLALGEPLDVAVLQELADPAAVEQAEVRGLISVQLDRGTTSARLAHPMYGEVRRAHMGQLQMRRLRGRIATALARTGRADTDDLLRRALLTLESDLAPQPDLFVAAARNAAQLMDLPRAERLARAAVAAGAGFDAQLTVAYAATFLSRGDEAEIEMRKLAELASSDIERATVEWGRIGNLFWTLRRPDDAEQALADAAAALPDEGSQRMLTAMRSAIHAWLARPHEAVACAEDALSSPALAEHAVPIAAFGLVAGLGVLGRADELGEAAARGYDAATRSFDVAFLRFPLAQLHLIGLRLAGYVDEAVEIAEQRHRESLNVTEAARMYGVALVGQAALARGRLEIAIRWLREARAGFSSFETTGHTYMCLLNLTQALAMSGDAAAARTTLAEAEAERHPAFVFVDPELMVSRAWVSAADGALSEAVATAHQAADLAAARGQLAHEVLALHAAVCFGDPTPAGRLATLAHQVDGPRAPAAAAQAAALAANDGEALMAASALLAEMGDGVSAADAAAQAAAAYANRGQRGNAQIAAARARTLAADCGGARTPTILAAAQPLPLTRREREIVTLAAHGLTNQQIADRLVVSVRTVEGHLYRASAKLGTSDRRRFLALLQG